MSQPARRPESRIPEFTSIEEEANFWDTHDFTDFLDELTPSELRVSPNLTSVYRMTIEGDDFHALDRVARARGVTIEALARLWLRERLEAEGAAAALTPPAPSPAAAGEGEPAAN